MCLTTECQTTWGKTDGTQGKTGKFTITFGDFNTPLTERHRSSRQKISKDIVELNSTIHQLDIIDIYRLLHPTTTEHTFFPSSHRTFTKLTMFWAIRHNKFKRIEIIWYLLSDHNGIKLKIKSRKIAGKSQNIWKKTRYRVRENLCKRYYFCKWHIWTF